MNYEQSSIIEDKGLMKRPRRFHGRSQPGFSAIIKEENLNIIREDKKRRSKQRNKQRNSKIF